MATAFVVVRARLANLADRPRFDSWYGTEHLPSGVREFAEFDRAWGTSITRAREVLELAK